MARFTRRVWKLVLLGRFVMAQSDLARDVVHFLAADRFEGLALAFELFVNLDGLLRHLLVCVFRAADEGKIRALRHALVAITVEADPQQDGLGFLFRGTLRHAAT